MQHLARQIAALEKQLTTLGAQVFAVFRLATDDLLRQQSGHAAAVRQRLDELDELAADLEEACLGTIALHVPVAFTLRQVISYLNTKQDLMHVANNALAINDLNAKLLALPATTPPCDLSLMVGTTNDMLAISLKTLVDRDPETATIVREMDDVVDECHQQMYENVHTRLGASAQHALPLLYYQDVSRHLERAADQATRIAKSAIFLTEGHVQKRKKPYPAPAPARAPGIAPGKAHRKPTESAPNPGTATASGRAPGSTHGSTPGSTPEPLSAPAPGNAADPGTAPASGSTDSIL